MGLFLDDSWCEKDTEWIPEETLDVRVGHVKKWLEKILANPEHCFCCGALKYDLVLTHDGKDYTFTLWKIADRTKRGKARVIAETDYKRLRLYLSQP
jgi:hypothetical protein